MKARSRAASSSTRASSTSTPPRIRTLRKAGAWLDRKGIATLFPGSDLVLPSLWEAVSGRLDVEWAIRDEEGRYVSFTPEMEKCWRWKDELPAQGLACVGKHLGRWSALVAPRVVPALYALTGRAGRPDDFRDADLPQLQRELAGAVLEGGPATAPELRALLGADKKQVDAAVVALQRALVLTNSGLVEQKQGWGAIAVDVLARRFPLPELPDEGEARRLLATGVLASAGEVSAADLAGALGWRRKRARETLEELVEIRAARRRLDDQLELWSPTSPEGGLTSD
jgi:winged helix DNA-binding protein